MSGKKRKQTRRLFLKTMGQVGAGTLLATAGSAKSSREAGAKNKSIPVKVPTRIFGKTGEKVSILSLGGVLDETDLLVFRQARRLGVTYWDTAEGYQWGNNEKAIGNYFSKFPEDRKKIFLVTKGASSDPAELSEKLEQSLARMKTDYVDLYFIHHVSDVREELTEEVRRWAEKVKAKGKIRYFGFSAHKNMEQSMETASGLGWIDGIMVSYNYRLMLKNEMRRAVDLCRKAGIGLTAMKTQAAFTANFYSSIGSETDAALGMTERFVQKGFTAEQARLKAVWENPVITSICSAMPNMTILQANAAAAMDRIRLSAEDQKILRQYARQTAGGYCAGCTHICEKAVAGDIPIGDIFRHAMYRNSYAARSGGFPQMDALSQKLLTEIRATDFAPAEQACPQGIEISRVLREETERLLKGS